MGRDKTVVAVLSILLFSTSLFVVAAVANSISEDDGFKGEWYLTFKKGYVDGEFVSEDSFDRSILFYVSDDKNGIIEGTFDGESFTGSVNDNIIRFRLGDDNTFSHMIGYKNVSGILIVSVVSYDNGILEAYSLLFTRDGSMPRMVDFLSLDIKGKWISNSSDVDMEIDITHQTISVAQGTMNYGGQITDFAVTVTMLQNDSMNWGMIINSDGDLWIISVKKGLMITYNVEVSGGELEQNVAYLVRDQGDVIVPIPVSLKGSTWTGTEGFKENREAIDVTSFSIRITEQKDCIISGEIIFNGISYTFAGIFVTGTIPFMDHIVSAELSFNINGDEVRAMMFIDSSTIRLITFDGLFPDDVASIKFVR